VLVGAWLVWSSRQTAKLRGGPMAFAMAGGVVLAMITVVSLVSIYPNRQHSAAFYQLACATYPLVLVAVASAGRFRLSATAAALCYTALLGVLVWLLPLIPGQPQVAPIYNPRDHLMPPPFPLILIVPALALDALLRVFPSRGSHPWRQAGECGLAFFLVFTAVQWNFARFLLSPAADHWFFAGGGRQWPFFLKIDEHARVTFWQTGAGEMNLANGLIAAGSAILAARAGLALGGWLQRVQR
jgi:hypothetical protein